MLEFFGAVAAGLAIVAPVVKNLGDLAKGGKDIRDVAVEVLARFRKKVQPNQQEAVMRQALTQAAAMPQVEFDKKAEEIVQLEIPDASPEQKKAITDYIKLIPPRIRTTFARPEDPNGTTVPANFAMNRPEDIITFLPPRPPLFREGDRPPGAPKYELVERLAIGGFGEVWKARNDTMRNTFRVFKFCLDPISQKFIFENEIDNIELVQNHLVDHNNIVKLIEANLDCETPWLQYEYIPGGDLGSLVNTWGDDIAVRASLAVNTLITLADTLDHCHNSIIVDGERKAVIHRDMKPANVLIGKNGTLKVTDFGISNTQARQALDAARIATINGMTITTPTMVRWASTPMYASEQQLNGDKPHTADDVHALGVMLYQLILGNVNRPLNKDYIKVLERKHVSGAMIELISRSIASDRDDRYQHAGELVEALKTLPKRLVGLSAISHGVDFDQELDRHIATRFADADAKNAEAIKLMDDRKWAEAITVYESIRVPRMRDQERHDRAIGFRDGKRFVNGIGMEFVGVPKGTFWMGGCNGKCGDKQVTIEHDFFIGVYPVTQEEWQKVMGSNPSWFQKGGSGADKLFGISDDDVKRFPVETVSWADSNVFIRKLNEILKETGWLYRMPYEAEWEYACRGAANTREGCSWSYYFCMPTNTLLPQQANFNDSGLERTCNVGMYEPNSLGIYDMHGNVSEWCEDSGGRGRKNRDGGYSHGSIDTGAWSSDHDREDATQKDLGLRLVRVSIDK